MRHNSGFGSVFVALISCVLGQDDIGLGNGYLNISTSTFSASIVQDAQVLASLQSTDGFDFLPFDLLDVRARNGQYHWGDITLRYREEGASEWIDGDSAQARQPVDALSTEDGVFAASNMSPSLPSGPLSVTREWLNVEDDLGLRFTIENTGETSIEIGSLGFPAEFNSIFTGRLATDMQRLCSLSDPYIGMDAGQIRVAPIRGTGKALVVTSLNGTKTPMEAYRNLNEPSFSETAYGSQTFEGFYEWQVLTQAWAENEWADQAPWNTPSSRTLEAGDSAQFGVRFSIADGVRDIEAAVTNTGTPVSLGVPGYIVPRDLPAQLLIQSSSAVSSISVEPEGAFTVASGDSGTYMLTPSTSAWGRVRLTIEYEDGKKQTVHYFITKATLETLADLGSFLTTEAWFNDTSDPFGRAPSVMTYDYEEGAILEQDSRAWVAGLSDEGGVGAYLAAMVKQTILPNEDEIAKLEDFVDGVLWGTIQTEDYAVRKAIFFYDPSEVEYEYDSSIDWAGWTSWNKEQAYYIDRAYDYVHVAAAYWSLYRVARAYPDIVRNAWDWYLTQAHETVIRCMGTGVGYQDVGLMGETVFGEILKDLEREGMTAEATAFEAEMQDRAELWDSQEIPYGSEMAWDSTGQEGVYYWTRHFGLDDSAAKTVDSVLGYMPSIPHWGWHGNARRYWDFIYGGKLQRIERQIHHYGSALNAQVLLSAFRDDPTDSYLLRVGYGGASGPLSGIHQDGFPSAAFHSFPDTLKWDAITGDYGPGFLGMALNSGTYVSQDGDLGLVAFGGILTQDGTTATVQPKDSVRKRVFIGPLGLLVTIDAGIIVEFSYESDGSVITVSISQIEGAPVAANSVIWLESTSSVSWTVDAEGVTEARGGWQVALSAETVTVQLVPSA